MSPLLENVISSVENSTASFYRYITANDTGATGAHQAGFYIPKCAASILFENLGKKGENKEKFIEIKWQNDFVTSSCFKYYGKGTRNEYRITRFGRHFPFFEDDNIGDILILTRQAETNYCGFVLHSDVDIDDFLSYFNLAPDSNNKLISLNHITAEDKLIVLFNQFISQYTRFPETKIMASGARSCYNQAYKITNNELVGNPDDVILKWIDSEYSLFRQFEEKVYTPILNKPFGNVESFVKLANEVLNRRKARAGKSLEHHLAEIFRNNQLIFEEQAITEINKQPDFLFPNACCYHNLTFPAGDLTVLGAKTTCKDRWRQIISEADRVDSKYLFTLQQGISRNQLREMKEANVKLVVPEKYQSCFPLEHRDNVNNLKEFIAMVKVKQERSAKHFLL